MAVTRRVLLQELFGAGGLSACGLAALLARPGVAEALTGALQDSPAAVAPGNAAAFWGSFLETSPHARSIFHKQPGTDPDRQVNYLHYSDAKGLRYSSDIQSTELPDYPGDVTASINVGGVRLSSADRATFEAKRSAQLRIDLLQGQRMYNILDPLAWMALAGIFPTKGGSFPPLQNLSFDPSSMQNMSQIVLPAGLAHLAVNVSMLPHENPFLNVLNKLVTDTSRIAPILGLPAISITALGAFSQLYGMLENHTTFLFQARPQLAYTTQQAVAAANKTSSGINFPAGDYVLVPQSQTDPLTPYINQLKLVNGYLVDKNAPSNASVYEQAESTKPDISYVTLNVGVKPMMQVGNGPSPNSPPPSDSSSSSKKKSSS